MFYEKIKCNLLFLISEILEEKAGKLKKKSEFEEIERRRREIELEAVKVKEKE